MRLIPQSLLGRLTLILIAGLLLALVVSFFFIRREGEETFARTRLEQRLDQIVAVGTELDRQNKSEREQTVRILRIAGIDLSLLPQPTAGPHEWVPPFITHHWRERLGPDRDVRVAWASNSERMLPSWGRLLVELRLLDGTWAQVAVAPQGLPWGRPRGLFGNLLLTLAAIVAAGFLAVRWVTRPLKELAAAATSLPQNLNRPPLSETAGPREARQAARAFNDMQQALRQMIDERTKALAAMSHDLRTPLTRLRLRTEMLDDANLRHKVQADLEEMQQMVDVTLDYMRGLQKSEVVRLVDMNGLILAIVDDFISAGRGTVDVQGQANTPYAGRPQALRRALSNLIDNALKYAGSVVVRVEDSQQCLRIIVEDQGPGIPDEALHDVLEPFTRVDDSRNRDTGGVGLGLTIVRDIAAIHGGTLALTNRPDGGLAAVIDLPRLREAPAI